MERKNISFMETSFPSPSIFRHTQSISNEVRFTPLRAFLSPLTSSLDFTSQTLELCTLEGGSDGVSAWSFLELYGLHYPKLCEIEGNTVDLNPGAVYLTCSRYWWLTVY